jgi:hypothetical protein
MLAHCWAPYTSYRLSSWTSDTYKNPRIVVPHCYQKRKEKKKNKEKKVSELINRINKNLQGGGQDMQGQKYFS